MTEDERTIAARLLVAQRQRFPGRCTRCGIEFPPSYAKRKYCSATCRQRDYQERHPEKVKEIRQRYRQRRAIAQDGGGE